MIDVRNSIHIYVVDTSRDLGYCLFFSNWFQNSQFLKLVTMRFHRLRNFSSDRLSSKSKLHLSFEDEQCERNVYFVKFWYFDARNFHLQVGIIELLWNRARVHHACFDRAIRNSLFLSSLLYDQSKHTTKPNGPLNVGKEIEIRMRHIINDLVTLFKSQEDSHARTVYL